MKKNLTIIVFILVLGVFLFGCAANVPDTGEQVTSSPTEKAVEKTTATPEATPTPTPTAEVTPTPTPTATPEATQKKTQEPSEQTGATASQRNAVKMAKDYLKYMPFSREGLIDQLEYEEFTTEDATYGVDNSDADWNEQAVKCAEKYLDYTSFSRQGLIDQLEYEGFTPEQAVYGVDATGLGSESSNADGETSGSGVTGTVSQDNALQKAKEYLKYMPFSRKGLIDQLEYEGFSNEDAVYGVDNSGADWNEQAVKSAEKYLDFTSFSRQGLIDQLEYEGYTHEQAVYGVDGVGL